MLVRFHGARKAEVKMTWRNILSDCVKSQYSRNASSKEVTSRKRLVHTIRVSDLQTLRAMKQRSQGNNEGTTFFMVQVKKKKF